jgi:7-cyano-7-deazaguanine tRNA-ribosyltransferase
MPTFEIRKTDLAGRIAILKTRNGTLETPALLPVIHPFNQIIKPKDMKEMGFNALMTNSYLMLKKNKATGQSFEVHTLLNFEKTIMTDSGAYQLLEYGEVEATPEEIVNFEKSIGSDIGVILDTPTGITRDKRKAEDTVNQTIEAARRSVPLFERDKTLWTGPIQGGIFYDLIERSAKEMSKFDFDIYALGSPTQIMEQYDFEDLVRMIVAAKNNIFIDKPLHLFGAGHPLTLPIAVALGCDLFDSASYILYAKRGAYITEYGTRYLEDMEYLPCECRVCSRHSCKEILESEEKVRLLALHNLYALLKEVNSIKQAISDGRLWEYVAVKSRSHPRTWTAFNLFKDLGDYFKHGTPLFKNRGLYLCGTPDQFRPESTQSFERIIKHVKINKKFLVLYLSTSNDHSFLYSLRNMVERKIGSRVDDIEFCAGVFPIGIVPIELCDIYPFSQYEISLPLDAEMRNEAIRKFKRFLSNYKFKKAILVDHSNGKYDAIVEWFCRERSIIKKKVVSDRRTDDIIREMEGLCVERT